MTTNPITYHETADKYPTGTKVSIGRLYVQTSPQEQFRKLVAMATYPAEVESDSERLEKQALAMVLDEDYFIEGLQELFPDYTIQKRK